MHKHAVGKAKKWPALRLGAVAVVLLVAWTLVFAARRTTMDPDTSMVRGEIVDPPTGPSTPPEPLAEPRAIRVLVRKRFFGQDWSGPVKNCSVPCLFTNDQALPVDGVLYHLPGQMDITHSPPKPMGQKWIFYGMESEEYYPIMKDSIFMDRFDIKATYHERSQVHLRYYGPRMAKKLVEWAPVNKTSVAPVVYIQSNCADKAGRNDYVKELSKHIDIDSYGKCLNNKQWPSRFPSLPGGAHVRGTASRKDRGQQTKFDVIARYPFTLTFENSRAKDYITEKFFDPLVVGSVPVYRGAPNLDTYAPVNHGHINADDFKGPEDLAAYLHYLMDHPALYQEYLQWKQDRRLRPEFDALVDEQRVHPHCRICLLLDQTRNERVDMFKPPIEKNEAKDSSNPNPRPGRTGSANKLPVPPRS